MAMLCGYIGILVVSSIQAHKPLFTSCHLIPISPFLQVCMHKCQQNYSGNLVNNMGVHLTLWFFFLFPPLAFDKPKQSIVSMSFAPLK